MKKLLKIILVLLIFVPGCTREGQVDKYTYTLERLDKFKEDDSLYTNSRLINYPSSVDKDAKTYEKKDLANLDYNKEIRFRDIYFRIPEKCEIFKKDDLYFIDFPLADSYNILISFKSLDSKKDLIELSKEIINKKDLGKNLVSKPVPNKLNGLESAYFITSDDSYIYTHFFIKSQNSTIYFIIKTDSYKTGSNIMADMLMTAYCQGDDVIEVNKSFLDYKNSLSVFATRDVEMSGLSLKIPENFYLNQDKENFKSFVAKKDNEVIGEIIMKEDKIDGSIYKALGENSGDVIYPAKIINMGKVSFSDWLLESDVRLYIKENTLTGKKFVIKRENSYLTIIVVGPLANQSLVKSMADSIRDSIR
ncbi:hypothetical protein [uncultured Anaerococcus sp.]|uniref:hypothetical protein n=1 Tax=uncultured Anaerococcus sp. TaxID=293428 RepID=UPI0025E0DA32|nr:hypothetical protein [uncultured Anaerococcus sp.]